MLIADEILDENVERLKAAIPVLENSAYMGTPKGLVAGAFRGMLYLIEEHKRLREGLRSMAHGPTLRSYRRFATELLEGK